MAKKSSPRQIRPSLPGRVVNDLYEANRLLEEGQPAEAVEILRELDRKYPDREPVLELLANACYDIQDWPGYEWALFQLVSLGVEKPEALMGVAGAHMINTRPAMAVQAFARFLRRWPDHEDAPEARKTMANLRAALGKETDDLGLPAEEAFDLSLQHEEVRFFLDHGRVQQSKNVAEKLLKRYPDFAPALNNLSQAYFFEGDITRGIELARKVLESHPDNVHALSNLTRMLLLLGNQTEVLEMAACLKRSTANAADVWAKKAEALSFVGDEEGIVELYEQAKKASELRAPYASPLFLHLAAVALVAQGEEKQARQLWKEALKANPNYNPARENLGDLDLPAWERNAPWAFSLAYWIPAFLVRELFGVISRASSRKKDQVGEIAVRKYLEKYPGLALLAPRMLAHGDVNSRRFIIELASASKSPQLLAALKDFALSRHGPDELRMEAARIASENGFIPAGPTLFWIKGKQEEILSLSFEISDEPQSRYESPKVQALAQKALKALNEKDGKRGQELLERAILLEPDSPSLLNNLAVALQLQERQAEARELQQQIQARFPDYFFGIIASARSDLEAGDLQKAREKLKSLMGRRQLHITEFHALCATQIDLFLAEKDKKSARQWFEIWEQSDPESPGLEIYRLRLGKNPFPFKR